MFLRAFLAVGLFLVLTGAYAPFPAPSTPTHILSAPGDNATSIKGSPGMVTLIVVTNTTDTLYYLKFYDTAAVPNCSSNTVVLAVPVPSQAISIPFPVGMSFLNGIGLCLVAGYNDNDDTPAQAGVVINVLWN